MKIIYGASVNKKHKLSQEWWQFANTKGPKPSSDYAWVCSIEYQHSNKTMTIQNHLRIGTLDNANEENFQSFFRAYFTARKIKGQVDTVAPKDWLAR